MKHIYTLLIFMFLGLTLNSQTIINTQFSQEGNILKEKVYYDNGTHEHFYRAIEAVPTDVGPLLNVVCNDPNNPCGGINLGACPGDVDSEGNPALYTDWQDYFSTITVEMNSPSLKITHSRLRFENQSNYVDNGIQEVLVTSCDNPELGEITEITYPGGGNRYSSVEEMNATLSVTEVKPLDLYHLPIGSAFYFYAVTGQLVSSGIISETTLLDLKTYSGLYYLRVPFYETLKLVNK